MADGADPHRTEGAVANAGTCCHGHDATPSNPCLIRDRVACAHIHHGGHPVSRARPHQADRRRTGAASRDVSRPGIRKHSPLSRDLGISRGSTTATDSHLRLLRCSAFNTSTITSPDATQREGTSGDGRRRTSWRTVLLTGRLSRWRVGSTARTRGHLAKCLRFSLQRNLQVDLRTSSVADIMVNLYTGLNHQLTYQLTYNVGPQLRPRHLASKHAPLVGQVCTDGSRGFGGSSAIPTNTYLRVGLVSGVVENSRFCCPGSPDRDHASRPQASRIKDVFINVRKGFSAGPVGNVQWSFYHRVVTNSSPNLRPSFFWSLSYHGYLGSTTHVLPKVGTSWLASMCTCMCTHLRSSLSY